MPNRASHDFLVTKLLGQLEDYEHRSHRLSLREQTQAMVEIQETVRQLGVAIGARAGFPETGALGRIRSYLEATAGEVIEAKELAVIAGISEYGRRIRELRKAGLKIATGPEAKDPATGVRLQPDQYLLIDKGAATQKRPFR